MCDEVINLLAPRLMAMPGSQGPSAVVEHFGWRVGVFVRGRRWFSIALNTARDQVIQAAGVIADATIDFTGKAS